MPIEPVTHGRSSGSAALPSSALAAPASSRSATAMTSSVARERAGADQHGDLLAAVEHFGGAAQIGVIGHGLRLGEADAGMDRAVLARRILVRHVLEIVGQDDRRHAALAERDADGAVDQMAHLRRGGSLFDERAGHVLEQARQIDFLLIVAADRGARLLAGNGEHRHVIEPRVVEAGDQMRGAGSGRRDADAKLAGEFGVGRSHERRHFLMPRLDELDLAVGAAAARRTRR